MPTSKNAITFANVNITLTDMKVIVKATTESGKYLLKEIKGLQEGTVIEGKLNGNALEFQWNGEDAVLWIGENCEEIKTKRNYKMPKGWMLDVYCRAVTDDDVIETAETKSELINAMNDRNWRRSEYTIEWVAIEYNVEEDYHGNIDALGDTKAEAVKNFWDKYESR